MVYREALEVPFFYGNRDPYVFLNSIKVFEEHFTWRPLKGHSCKDYAKRKLLRAAQAWWKEVECQLYQYPPTWNEMKLLLKDKYVHGRDLFFPAVEVDLKPMAILRSIFV